MAEKKLFGVAQESTPSDTSLNIAYGSGTVLAKNMTLANLKSWIVGGGGLANQVVMEIGPWDMNDDSFGDPSTTINVLNPAGDPVLLSKIRGLSSAIIFNNAGSGAWEFLGDVDGTVGTAPVAFLGISGGYAQLALFARVGGFFQTTSVFSGTATNRGYVVINYAS